MKKDKPDPYSKAVLLNINSFDNFFIKLKYVISYYLSMNSIKKFFKNIDIYAYISIILSTIFFILFSIFSYKQYLSVGDSAFDLGVTANVLYYFIHGYSFYSPLLGSNLLSQHFALFDFLIVPVYFIYQSPISLLIFENFFTAYAGLILYFISRNFLNDKLKSKFYLNLISIMFLILYEMSPYTQSLISFPFHREAFLPFFFFLAIYSFFNEKRILHYFSLAMIVSLHSNFIFIVGVILLYELFYLRTYKGKNIKIWLSKKYNAHKNINILYFIIFVVILYLYFVFAGFMKGYISGSINFSTMPTSGASGSAAGSPLGLILLIFKNPHLLIKYILIGYPSKIFYLKFMIEGTLIMALFSPLSLIMTLPYLLYAIPSSYSSYYQLGYQYTALLLAPIFISMIIGFYNILRIIEKINNKYLTKNKIKNMKIFAKIGFTAFITIMIIVSIVMMPYGLFGPIEHNPHGSQMQHLKNFNNNAEGIYLINISKSIPKNAYILTQNNLMPYFSNHPHIYQPPLNSNYKNNTSMFQYIIVQNTSYWASCNNPSLNSIVHNDLNNHTYKVIPSYKKYNISVLERN